MAHDVFISYAAEDKPIADAVCASLEGKAVRCWIAPRDVLPGMDWGEAIVDALVGSKLLVLVYSSSSNQSAHVRREVERAEGGACSRRGIGRQTACAAILGGQSAFDCKP